jgi:DNA-binding FadR family transcriptional regulator
MPPERVLAAQLGVGRRAVRRALDVLEAEGVVSRRQGRGTFVGTAPVLGPRRGTHRRSDAAEAAVMEARVLVEPCLARLAAQRATADDAARLERLARNITAADDADARELWDGAFHRQIARLAANPLLLDVFDMIDAIRGEAHWQALRATLRDEVSLAETAAQHRRIVEAVAHGAAAEAEMAMRSHLLAIAGHLAAGRPEMERRADHAG